MPAWQDTLLLVVAERGGPAVSVTLLAADANGTATVVFVAGNTLVEIPGFGRERLAAAHRLGGAALVEASLENALGIAIDHSVATSRKGLTAFLSGAAPLPVDVPHRLVDDASVVLPAGPQQLDADALVTLWTFRGDGEDDLDGFNRQQLVWRALLGALGDDAARERAVGADAALPRPDGTEDDAFVRGLLGTLSDGAQGGHIGFELLPVSVFGAAEDGPTYRLVDTEVADLVGTRFAASRPGADGGERLRLQVLNGVGTPGIGRAVDARLDGEPLEVVLTDNASNFDHRRTRILVYGEDPAVRAAAERVRDRLGIGTIELSRQPQSVVDLTIVVGADFDGGEGG